MGLLDIILVGILLAWLAAAIVFLRKRKKTGGCIGCGGSCAGCKGCKK